MRLLVSNIESRFRADAVGHFGKIHGSNQVIKVVCRATDRVGNICCGYGEHGESTAKNEPLHALLASGKYVAAKCEQNDVDSCSSFQPCSLQEFTIDGVP